MDVEALMLRLRDENATQSLRKMAAQCGVSHERLRGIVKAESPPNLTIATYRKILDWLNSTQGSNVDSNIQGA